MNLHLSADNAPLVPESLTAMSEFLTSAIDWMTWGGMILCTGWIVVYVAKFMWGNSNGAGNPGQLGRIAPALVGFVVLGSVQLLVSSLLGDRAAEPHDTSAETPLAPPLPVPAAPAPAPDEPMNWTPFAAAGVIIATFIALGALGAIALRARNQIVDRRAAAADREKDWHTARTIFDHTRSNFADYLTDPYAIFERPILDDHTDTFTAAFLAALTEAEALHTETVPRTAQRIDTFRTAANTLAAAWTAADRHARTVGMGVLTRDQRKTLKTIEGVLAIALDESAPVGEREAAMAAVTRLSQELPMPVNTDRIAEMLTLSLESAQRKALTI
ncbi:UNVERIFIED_ORG: hypothetical protein FNL38_11135 [Nocardia globerula]|uniref:Uncharacterized protein n=1 Tax=Nocardia globerula TaxID=1818 RepID=A0A652YHV3_NOCGL|nr:hypothetical protein [Nocardia globerula]